MKEATALPVKRITDFDGEWVAVLRAARDESNAASIAQATHAGPLPAHALRARVLSLA